MQILQLVYNVSSKETKSLVCELHANTTKKQQMLLQHITID
jgi:hypothetical protein